MKNKVKKLMAVLLTLTIMLGTVPAFLLPARAAEGDGDPVCRIGPDKMFGSIAEAVDAAANGDVITVLRAVKGRNMIKVSGKSVVINGGGNDIDLRDGADNESMDYNIWADNGGSITFTNCRNIYIGGKVGVQATNGGSVNFTDGYITIYCYDIGAYATSGGKINIDGYAFKPLNRYCSMVAADKVAGFYADGAGSAIFAEAWGRGGASGIRALNGAKVTITGYTTGDDYGVYADGRGTVVSVGNSVLGSATAVGIWARNGAHVSSGDVSGYIGVKIADELDIADLGQPLDYYTTVKVKGDINPYRGDAIDIYNGGGVVIAEQFVGSASGTNTLLVIGEQPKLGTPQVVIPNDEREADEPPARFNGEYTQSNRMWYYYGAGTNTNHSYTIMNREPYDCSIGDVKYGSFLDALNAVHGGKNGQTIKLLRNVNFTMELLEMDERVFTIDLNGFDLKISAYGYPLGLTLHRGSILNIKGKGTFSIFRMGVHSGSKVNLAPESNLNITIGMSIDGGSAATVTNAAGIAS